MRRLIIRPGAIGDFIVSLPAMEHLRSDYLEIWSLERNLPLVRFADAKFSYVATGLDTVGISPTPRQLLARLGSFDEIVSWYGSNRPEFREALRGLPVRFFDALPPHDYSGHAADFYLEQAGGTPPGIPALRCQKTRGNFAVIHPFSGSARKNWPFNRFRRLADRLEREMPVHWCAGPEEALPGAIRIDDLWELACWLAGARLFIGNDSGISHLAAAVGTPTVAIFGPTSPLLWAPRGQSVRLIHAPDGSLLSVSVNQVEGAVRSF
jgi:heptosyltransferase-2